MPPILEIRNLSKTFANGSDGIPALRCVDFSVNPQEIVSILGPSGCGKTTLLECITGLCLPNEGSVYIKGEQATGRTGMSGYMTQSDVMLPWYSVLDNVSLPLVLNSTPQARAREEALNVLRHFGLEVFSSAHPASLSGGMRQRAALARTYLTKQELLVLDEPFGRLDALTRSEMQTWFLRIWEQEKKTVLMVTHDIDEALLLSDRVLVFTPRPGAIVEEIMVTLPRPRPLITTTLPAFGSLKEKALKALHIN